MSQVEGKIISGSPGETPEGSTDVDIDSVVDKFLAEAEEAQKTNSDTETKVEDSEETEKKAQASGEEAEESGETKVTETTSQEEAKWLKQKTDLERQLREATKKVKEYEESVEYEEEEPGPSATETAIVQELLRNPGDFFRKYGVDSKAAAVGKRLLGAALGDDAPENFQKQLKELDTVARIEALEAEIRSSQEAVKNTRDEAARQVRAEMLVNDLTDLMESESFASKYPYLGVILNDPDDGRKEAENALELEAIDMVKTGKWPSAKKVVETLEAKLARKVSRFEKLKQQSSEESETQEDEGKERKSPKALSDKKGSVKKSKKDLKKEQENWTADDWAAHAEKFVLENRDNFK